MSGVRQTAHADSMEDMEISIKFWSEKMQKILHNTTTHNSAFQVFSRTTNKKICTTWYRK